MSLETKLSVQKWIRESMKELRKGQYVQISDRMFYEAFHQNIDPLKELALTMNGNRPSETTDDVVNLFCESEGCRYYYSSISGEHLFIKDTN